MSNYSDHGRTFKVDDASPIPSNHHHQSRKGPAGLKIVLLTLNYHRIAYVEPGGDFWGLSVSPENFASQLEVLVQHFDIVDPRSESLVAASEDPGDRILVTFDDGYADNLYEALPVLQRYDVPAVIFLASGYVGKPYFWWDAVEAIFRSRSEAGITVDDKRLHATWKSLRDQRSTRDLILKELLFRAGNPDISANCRPLTEAEIRVLAASPLISFGGHTRWHSWLPGLPPKQIAEEIWAGKCDNEFLTGQRQVAFAYPFGAVDANVQRAVMEAGFPLAFTTSPPDKAAAARDPLGQPRIAIGNWGKECFFTFLTQFR